ncbi:DNA helicase [Elysia marginata]|uniref:DNA helicase n=1 Tax=Elysia marginata TaxID=1093978 RepID=A0AAV4J9X6_9GAST|nr:DNA helicase [Elysia marginata]
MAKLIYNRTQNRLLKYNSFSLGSRHCQTIFWRKSASTTIASNSHPWVIRMLHSMAGIHSFECKVKSITVLALSSLPLKINIRSCKCISWKMMQPQRADTVFSRGSSLGSFQIYKTCCKAIIRIHVIQLKYAYEFARSNFESYVIVINEQARPIGEHERRFNAPSSLNDVAILIPNDPVGHRDIVLHTRNGECKCISELHKAYMTLFNIHYSFPLVQMVGIFN